MGSETPYFIPIDEAVEISKTRKINVPTETISIDKAYRRILSESLQSLTNDPPFDNSAMDGFAAIHSETKNPPKTFNISNTVEAGNKFDNSINPGEAIRIMTGAPIPKGADSIIPIELCELDEANQTVTFIQESKPHFIRKKGENFALNEISVIKKDSSSMIKIHCYIDNKFICTYWSDGLIISTPTGSTGYSLSCGGPILTPDTNNLIITPISPHNLGLRSIIISDSSKIKLQIENQKFNFLVSMDSRSYTFKGEQTFIIEKSKFEINLIHPNNFDFFETLRKKLNWGLDLRN